MNKKFSFVYLFFSLIYSVAGAWIITRKALETLYPSTLPVRGQIIVMMPGEEDEWFVGVFGQVISYITGAAPKAGFPGAELGRYLKGEI